MPILPEEAPQPIAVNATNAARMLSIGERKLWELTQCGKIPHFRVGRSVRYPVASLIEWAHEQTQREAQR
mgnify:CR=1 FL=1